MAGFLAAVLGNTFFTTGFLAAGIFGTGFLPAGVFATGFLIVVVVFATAFLATVPDVFLVAGNAVTVVFFLTVISALVFTVLLVFALAIVFGAALARIAVRAIGDSGLGTGFGLGNSRLPSPQSSSSS